MNIPFSRPYITDELDYIAELLGNISKGWNISGDGRYTARATKFLETRFEVEKALLTTSCTGALEMATRLLNLSPGDEVISPSFTFSSTVNPILLVGAKPVFAEIQEDTLNIDPVDIEQKITCKTRAIYVVHYAGVACDMDKIMKIADDHGLYVVEDAAHAVNAKYKDRYLGTIGDLGCYSFHDTKNYVCGEGGALLINNDDKNMVERAEIMREKGTNRSKFFRGEVDKYTWVDIGSSHLPSDILAAFLCSQFEKLDNIQCMRLNIHARYMEAFAPLEEKGIVRLPVVPEYACHNAHLFYMLLDNRDTIISKLRARGVHATFHYIPLHSAHMGKKLGYREGDFPVTEIVSSRLLRLPLYPGMTGEQIDYVISSVMESIE